MKDSAPSGSDDSLTVPTIVLGVGIIEISRAQEEGHDHRKIGRKAYNNNIVWPWTLGTVGVQRKDAFLLVAGRQRQCGVIGKISWHWKACRRLLLAGQTLGKKIVKWAKTWAHTSPSFNTFLSSSGVP